jgi:RNA polymerase sigma-70 factor (ECF subfamily)
MTHSLATVRLSSVATPHSAIAMAFHRSHSPLSLVVGADRRALSDGDVARALATGAGWAVAETWARFAPMVLMMATRTLGSESEAEDISQEVFYRVFHKAKTLRDPDCLRSFVVSFAIRVLKTELRRKRTRSWLSFHQPELFIDLAQQTEDVEARDLLRRFYGLLDRLNPRDRLVFALRYLERMTVEEVAATLELSMSTVKRSLNHATSKLSRWVGSDPGMASLLDGKGWNR